MRNNVPFIREETIMKRILCFIFVMLLVMLTACTSKKDSELSKEEINDKISKSENQAKSGDDVVVPTPTSKMIGIYSIEDDTLGTVNVDAVVTIDGELKVTDVIDAVVGELEDHDIYVVIGSVSSDEGKVTIDIKADDPFLPFGSLGSSAEGSVLDCLSLSIFDNFSDINAVYFLVNGQAYETGHIQLAADEPYITR